MRLCRYAPEHFDVLARAAAGLGRDSSLLHRPFVDHYYASRPWCQLWLALDGDALAGTIGFETMRFETEAGETNLGFASNFHALADGVGGHLYLAWMKSCPAGLVFGSSEDARRIYRSQGWRFFSPVPIHELNKPTAARPDDPLWRQAVKAVARGITRRPIPHYARRLPRAAAGLEVMEERSFTADLLDRRSPFAFRFAPTLEHLSWRYATDLSFVRYRLFRIREGTATTGYVVINDGRDRLIVAHCDGDDPDRLALGVLRAILRVGENDTHPRTVVVTATHPGMRRVYEAFGFETVHERPFAIGAVGGSVDVTPDAARWLVSFDWGDNGLRTPFLDQR